MVRYKKMPISTSLYIRYLHQESGLSPTEIARRYNFPRRTIHYHAKLPVPNGAGIEAFVDRRHKNPGRPRKILVRDERAAIRSVGRLRQSHGPSFTSELVQSDIGLHHVSRRSMRRCLNRLGYSYCQLRKKGLVTISDQDRSLHFRKTP